MATLGIDFGSSFCTVSWLNPDSGKPEAVKFGGDGQVKYPSVMLYSDYGLMMGFQAASYFDQLARESTNIRMAMFANLIPSLKRIMEPGMNEMFSDKTFTHEELLRVFLKNLIDKANKPDVNRIVFSYPVYYPQAKVQMMNTAFNQLGYSDVKSIYEPVAAVKGYGINNKIEEGEGILVFDFGGGTIDVAYVKKEHGRLQVVTEPKGNSLCGGQDIDFLLYENLRTRILKEMQFDISEQGIIDQVILKQCRWLKEQFSEENEMYGTKIGLVYNGRYQTYEYRLSRESFYTIISPKVDEAIGVAKQVIQTVRDNEYSINKVLLIGGSSRLTLVRQQLGDLLGNIPIDTFGESDIAVALGTIASDDNAIIEEHEKCKWKYPPQREIKENIAMLCGNINCHSPRCYRYKDMDPVNGFIYHCVDCGWEGHNVGVVYRK